MELLTDMSLGMLMSSCLVGRFLGLRGLVWLFLYKCLGVSVAERASLE